MLKKIIRAFLLILFAFSLFMPIANNVVFAEETTSQKYAILNENLEYSVCYDNAEEIVFPNEYDFKIFDERINDFVDSFSSVIISVSYNNGNFVALKNDSFNAYGEYVIKYSYDYFAIDREENIVVYRTISYLPNFSGFIMVNQLPKNTQALTTLQEPEIMLKALVGETIEFPSGFVSTTRTFQSITLDDGVESVDIKDVLLSGTYSLTPTKPCIYRILFTVEDDFYGYCEKQINIDVRNKWYTFDSSTVNVEVGSAVASTYPKVVDFYGNEASGFQVEFFINGEKYSGKQFNDLGLYKAVLAFNRDGEIINDIYYVRVQDTTNPIIKIDDKKSAVRENAFVAVDNYTIEDNSQYPCDIEISVYKDGESVVLYNNGFDAKELGVYSVNYKITDASGNITLVSYQIEVVSNVPLIIMLSLLGISLVGATVFVLKIIKNKKRNRGIKND